METSIENTQIHRNWIEFREERWEKLAKELLFWENRRLEKIQTAVNPGLEIRHQMNVLGGLKYSANTTEGSRCEVDALREALKFFEETGYWKCARFLYEDTGMDALEILKDLKIRNPSKCLIPGAREFLRGIVDSTLAEAKEDCLAGYIVVPELFEKLKFVFRHGTLKDMGSKWADFARQEAIDLAVQITGDKEVEISRSFSFAQE